MQEFEYEQLMKDEKSLMDWIVTVEKYGCAMVKNCPSKDTAGCELIKRVGFVKQSHYG